MHILLLIGSSPLNAIILVLIGGSCMSYSEAVVFARCKGLNNNNNDDNDNYCCYCVIYSTRNLVREIVAIVSE